MCYNIMKAVFGCSCNKLRAVRGTPGSSAGPVHRPHPGRSDEIRTKVICYLHIQKMLSSIQPNSSEVHLPFTERQTFFEHYMMGASQPGFDIWIFKPQRIHYIISLLINISGSDFPPCSSVYFHQIWREAVPELKVRKHHRFSLCDLCVLLSTKAAQSHLCFEEKLQVAAERQEHLQMVNSCNSSFMSCILNLFRHRWMMNECSIFLTSSEPRITSGSFFPSLSMARIRPSTAFLIFF